MVSVLPIMRHLLKGPSLRLWNKHRAEDEGEDPHDRITPEREGGTNRPNQQQEGDTDEQIGNPVAKGRNA